MTRDLLVVEDNFILAIDVEDMARSLGVSDVRVASNIVGARKAISERRPDFVLLDIGLEGETTFELAAELEAGGIRVAFASGHVIEDVVPPALRHIPHLAKPFSSDHLKDVIDPPSHQRQR